MSIFGGRQCALVFPIYVRKYRKYTIDRWIVVNTVCASAVISPLRQWLDFYAKTRLKMCHTFKHFIHMQYFFCWLILLSSLYIELALVYCTNPDKVHWFGTIFPNLTLFLRQAVPPVRSIFNPTNAEVAQLSNKDREQPQTAPWLWVREITWYLYTRGVRVRMKAKQRWFKVPRELCHEWFHHVRHRVHDGHWTGEFASHLTSTLFHSLVPW